MRIPLIHVSNIDMQNSAIVNELLGRTGSADLRQVLNADIGSVDTSGLQGGLSNAQLADARNPHPDGLPFYEMTWKVVFLNSLVGRTEGRASKVFGISRQDAYFQLAAPLLAPSQVRTALEEISESAFYLRFEDGKYFADVEPTINSILARIRQTVDDSQIQQKLKSVADSQFKDFRFFRVEHDVRYPQDISDTHDAPTVAVVSLSAGEINVRDMFQFKGDAAPRIRQNTVLLLVPKTVKVVDTENELMARYTQRNDADDLNRLDSTARQVLAIELLKARPEAYGIAPSKLNDSEFVEKGRERSVALQTVVAEMYNSFYFYSRDNLERKELRTSSGEGSSTVLTQIMHSLLDAGKLVYSDTGKFDAARLKSLAERFFFHDEDKASCADIYSHFLNYRTWPMLANRETLEQLLRDGVESGVWVAYKRSENPTDSFPAEFYSDRKQLPLSVQFLNGGYSIMTMAGARKRGWTQTDAVPDEKVQETLHDVMASSGAATVEDLTRAVQARHINATEEQVCSSVRAMVQSGGFSLYEGQAQQLTRPETMVTDFGIYGHTISPRDVLISRGEASERGWNSDTRSLSYTDRQGAEKLKGILNRLGSLYTRGGATCDVDELDISDMKLQSGATMRVQIEGATAADMKALDEFFQELANVAKFTEDTQADIVINHPDENCALVKKLRE